MKEQGRGISMTREVPELRNPMKPQSFPVGALQRCKVGIIGAGRTGKVAARIFSNGITAEVDVKGKCWGMFFLPDS